MKKNIKIPDFVLINTNGKIVDEYYINEPQSLINQIDKRPFLFLKKESIQNNRIRKGKIYLPYSIYIEDISALKNVQELPKQLLEFNLKTKKSEFLNISIPLKEIEEEFTSDIFYNWIDFQILGSDIIFTFPFSSTIYSFSLKNKKTIIYESHKQFFNNYKLNDSISKEYIIIFYNPVYNAFTKRFYRRVEFQNKKTRTNSISIKHIFDSKFHSVGYDIANLSRYVVSINSKGILTAKSKIDHNFYYMDFANIFELNIDTVKKTILDNILFPNTIVQKKQSIETRMNEYYKSLGIKHEFKIIQINTDISCYQCLDFLMRNLNKYQNKFIDSNIYYLFVGQRKDVIINIMNSYRIKLSSNVIFDDSRYLNYLTDEEIHNTYFVKNTNKLQIESISYELLVEKYFKFINDER